LVSTWEVATYARHEKPHGDDVMAVVCELPLLDFGKASANVFGKRTVDGYMGYAVGWVSKPLEISFASPYP